MTYSWDKIQRNPDGTILLLYRHQRIFDEGLIRAEMDVLDVGGWGVLAQAILEAGASCTIADLFTPDQYYPDRVRSLPHVVGDVTVRESFEDATFDVITCFETLEHVKDIDLALANMRAWLRPGGVLVGTVPLPGFCHFPDEAGITLLSEQELMAKLKKAKFKKVKVTPTPSRLKDSDVTCLYFQGAK